MSPEIEIEDVHNLLNQGYRVLMFIRHAERPHIDHEDPTFGAHLPLTPRGIKMAEAFGQRFKAYAMKTQFLASPLLRTLMTAQHIAQGMELPPFEMPTDDKLGNDTFYFQDAHEVWQQFRDGKFFAKIFQYFKDGDFPGFANLQQATNALEDWALARWKTSLGIFTTHDLYNGAFLVARKVFPAFTEETWIQYLDAATIIISPNGEKSYSLVRSHAEEMVK